MATLTNTKIKDTYDGLLKTTDNDVIGASEKVITDGLGNASVLSIGTASASFSSDIEVNTLTIGLGSGSIATNTALGLDALLSNTSGSGNVSVGQGSMRSNTIGLSNVAVGKDALRLNTSGSNNTSLGYISLYSNTTGGNNTAVGSGALADNTTGGSNVAMGKDALNSNTVGSNITAIGRASMSNATAGNNNTAVGFYSLVDNQASNNVAVGDFALRYNTTGGANTALGSNALRDNTTGAYNTAIGSGAGDTNTTGSSNVYIGYNAVGSAATNDNEIVIGSGVTGKGSNTTFIDGDDIYLGDGALGGVTIERGANTLLELIDTSNSERFSITNNYIGGAVRYRTDTLDHKFLIGNDEKLNVGSSTVSVSGNLAVDTNTLYVDAANNRVGIGESIPQRNLHINGTEGVARFTSTASGNDGLEVGIGTSSQAFLWLAENSHMQFATNNTERMRIDSSGNVGIGTVPSEKLHVNSGSGNVPALFESTDNLALITFKDNGTTLDVGIGADDNDEVFYAGGSERMRIYSDGNVQLQTVNAQLRFQNSVGPAPFIANAGTGDQDLYISTGGSESMRIDSSGRMIMKGEGLQFERSLTTLLPPDDSKGLIYQREGYSSGADTLIYSSRAHAFLSHAGGEYMRIDSSGNVGINCSPNATLEIKGNLKIQRSSNVETSEITMESGNFDIKASPYGYPIAFHTGTGGSSSERMRITSGGILAVGKSTSLGVENAGLYVAPNDFMSYTNTSTDTGDRCVIFNRQSAVGTVVDFRTGNSTKGSITISSSAVAYNTTSDYRLKENVVEMTGALDRVDALKPSRFNFIADPNTTVDGFLAHEVAEVVPEAISGEKDAVDEEGNPIYQGIDQSKIVPLLVGAIKELKAEIELLKSQLS